MAKGEGELVVHRTVKEVEFQPSSAASESTTSPARAIVSSLAVTLRVVFDGLTPSSEAPATEYDAAPSVKPTAKRKPGATPWAVFPLVQRKRARGGPPSP